MALNVKITEKVADGVWNATGTFSGKNKAGEEVSGDADVLLKESDGKLQLMLDSKIKVSTIFGSEVVSYVNAPKVAVKKIAPGTEVECKNFWFTPK